MLFRRTHKVSKVGHYPPIYYERLRDSKQSWLKWFAYFTPLVLVAVLSFVCDWKTPFPILAPFLEIFQAFSSVLGAIWIYSAIIAPFSLRDYAIACVLPYFPNKSPCVGADTFLHGYALARHFQILELWAYEHNVPPLSVFGWNDDLHGDPLTWHDAALGLQTVASLLKYPDISPELREDLTLLESALHHAQEVGAPFCLLLRQGNAISGAEMDARQGTFW